MLPLSPQTFFSHILKALFFMGVLEELDGEEEIKGAHGLSIAGSYFAFYSCDRRKDLVI